MKWGAGLLEELEMITGAWYLPIEQKISDLSRAGPCRETEKPERNPGNASGRHAAAVFLQSPGNQKLFNTHCGCHTHYKHCLSHVSGCCDYKSEMKPFSSPLPETLTVKCLFFQLFAYKAFLYSLGH